ncbi:MAG: hypothetical protein ACI81V_000768 [Lentimonas sp.]|jgi:hypothetical protein
MVLGVLRGLEVRGATIVAESPANRVHPVLSQLDRMHQINRID